jgi:formylmethanofuran dehydrogenase subunit B
VLHAAAAHAAAQAGTALADACGVDAHWTCPFCSLLCDSLALEGGPDTLLLNGSNCPRSRTALAAHVPRAAASALVDGQAAPLEEAIAAAGQRLASWRQPLFGGMGTDMAGARALFRLAARTGAICDHADGEELVHGLRALQDRGQFHTTLAEIRARADLVVCVGTQAVARYPEFFARCGFDRPDTPCARLVFLGVAPPAALPEHVKTEHVAGSDDLFLDLQQLAIAFGAAPARTGDPALAALAAALRAARYAVFVWEAATLPRHGALALEMLHRIVMALNRSTRAASFGLGGSDGAATVQQVFTWLSGLPLRTRVASPRLAHEPVRFAADRLLSDGAVDGLLWTWTFSPERLPPPGPLPRIVLGPAGMAPRLREQGAAADCVFVPVATPGLNAPGHLFRTDGLVVPLSAAREDGLPSLARVADGLFARLEAIA